VFGAWDDVCGVSDVVEVETKWKKNLTCLNTYTEPEISRKITQLRKRKKENENLPKTRRVLAISVRFLSEYSISSTLVNFERNPLEFFEISSIDDESVRFDCLKSCSNGEVSTENNFKI